MAKKKSSKNSGPSVKIGGNVGRDVNIASGDLSVTNTNVDPAALEKLFASMFQQMQSAPAISPQVVADVKPMVEEIKTEALKGDKADGDKVARTLRIVAAMGTDIFDVVTAGLAGGPIGVVGAVVQKIAKKAREDQGLK